MTLKLVPKPTASEEAVVSVVNLLRDILAQAERGEIDNVAVILNYTDGDWGDRTSEALEFSKAIGRLEILKARWIAQYLEDDK